MYRHAIKSGILLASLTVAALAQESQPSTQTLDEIGVAAPQDRDRGRGPTVTYGPETNAVTLSIDATTVRAKLQFASEQQQVVFRRGSAARQLPGDEKPSRINRRLHLELLPDRLVATEKPWLDTVELDLAANIDENDGVPAQIPFGNGLALVNLEYLQPAGTVRTRFALTYAMHPLARTCQSQAIFADIWSSGSSPYVLLAKSNKDCNRARKGREGDLLFAESVPPQLKRAVLELYDPIASRLANRLGSEPGTMFVAWWPESPHDGHRLELGWGRNSLLLLNGTDWQQGIDAAQRESLRVSFMREQLQRRISEADLRGPFTQSAVSYLLLLTRGDEIHATSRQLRQELPGWIEGCNTRLQNDAGNTSDTPQSSSIECGQLVQFVYDAVARAESSGRQNLFDIWRKLLDEAYHAGRSGTTPAKFMASYAPALEIVKSIVGGSADWPEFVAALAAVGVRLRAVPDGSPAHFEVQSLEHFED